MEWFYVAGAIAAGALVWLGYKKFGRKQDSMTEDDKQKTWLDQQW